MEIAFVSSNKLKTELERAKGKLSGRIISGFQEKPSLFIAMLLLGNNIALVIYGMYMEKTLIPGLTSILPDYLQSQFVILLLETIIATLIILLFAEFLPKTVFRINANASLNVGAVLLQIMYYLLLPFVFLIIKISEFILKYIFGTPVTEKKYAFSSADLEDYVKEFTVEETMEESVESDLQIFQNAIDFKKVKVRECMVPRTEISAIDIYSPIDELRVMFEKTGHSKILLFEEKIDNIIGYVHAYDLFKSPEKISQIKRNIHFVPETMAANKLLEKMIKEKISITVVLDEFGGTSGVVTLEDLMEEIFGEIEDEFDSDNLTEKQNSDGSLILSARLEIDYLNEKYHLGLKESEEYETIGGFIINQNEDIPKKGDTFVFDDFEFKILKASNTKIELIKMKKISGD
jgi:CBS domain containing-hemolysin-like protein